MPDRIPCRGQRIEIVAGGCFGYEIIGSVIDKAAGYAIENIQIGVRAVCLMKIRENGLAT
jgi:hypothetical protein